MTTTFKFECWASVCDGWVACGTAQGVAGGSFEERPVWFGCQGDTWEELQAGMARLAEVLGPRLEPNLQLTPIQVHLHPWPETRSLLVPPVGTAEALFHNLVNVGSRRRAFVENVEEIRIVSFLKLGALALVLPAGAWKPELVSGLLAFAVGLVPAKPTPAPERAGQTSADLVEEILRGGRE